MGCEISILCGTLEYYYFEYYYHYQVEEGR